MGPSATRVRSTPQNPASIRQSPVCLNPRQAYRPQFAQSGKLRPAPPPAPRINSRLYRTPHCQISSPIHEIPNPDIPPLTASTPIRRTTIPFVLVVQLLVRRSSLLSAKGPIVNRWNIPKSLEGYVLERDNACVYCGVDFTQPPSARGSKPSWEHIINDAKIVTAENIARCCMSCNASKGAKDLFVWLQSSYCKGKGITVHTVSKVVQNALSKPPAHASA